MSDNLLMQVEVGVTLLIVLCVIGLVFDLRKKRVRFIDDGNGEVFRNKKYGISAIPDLIEDKNTIVEKKSRKQRVYPSDRKQVIATALAVRSKYKINRGVIVTQNDRVELDLSMSDQMLFSLIKQEYKYARMVRKGRKPPPSPTRGKCKRCQFRERCEYAA